MGVPSFFKAYRPKEYRYIPRYYDPEKEARKKRNREIEAEVQADKAKKEGKYISSIQRGSMQSYFHQKQSRVKRYTAIRLVVILIILFVISYIIIYL